MKRTRVALIAGLLMLATVAQAQQPGRPYRIGVLNEAWSANHPTVEGLKAGLRELGMQEGRDVAFEIRFTKGDPKAIKPAAEELVRSGVDLLFTSNEAATVAAKGATQSVPIIFTLVGDPVAAGIVKQLARPGGNLTGVSSLTSDLMPKRIELLKTLMPSVKRVWFIYDSTDPTGSAALEKGLIAAKKLDLRFIPIGIADVGHVASILETVKPGEALLAPEQDGFDISASILEKSLSARIAAIYPASLWISHGALASYGPDYRAQGMQAARLVAKVLRGARPRDLPVEGSDKIELAINLKTAAALGTTVPRKLLLRADQLQR
jgi:putative tryptophan/tyrosine transport system substrate-binding protein